jgi:hypothetical protein
MRMRIHCGWGMGLKGETALRGHVLKKKRGYEVLEICWLLFALSFLFLLLSFLSHHTSLFVVVFFFVFLFFPFFFHGSTPQKPFKAQQGVYMHFVQKNTSRKSFSNENMTYLGSIFSPACIF